MVSLDSKAAGVAVLAVVVFGVLSAWTGIGQQRPVVGLALVLGVGFLAPQAYLLYRGDDVPRRTRLRSVGLVAVVWAWAATAAAEPSAKAAFGALTVGLFLAWVVAEFALGFRESTTAAGGR